MSSEEQWSDIAAKVEEVSAVHDSMVAAAGGHDPGRLRRDALVLARKAKLSALLPSASP